MIPEFPITVRFVGGAPVPEVVVGKLPGGKILVAKAGFPVIVEPVGSSCGCFRAFLSGTYASRLGAPVGYGSDSLAAKAALRRDVLMRWELLVRNREWIKGARGDVLDWLTRVREWLLDGFEEQQGG